jgi:hypothetical protein
VEMRCRLSAPGPQSRGDRLRFTARAQSCATARVGSSPPMSFTRVIRMLTYIPVWKTGT